MKKTHDLIEATYGDDVIIAFSVTDKNDEAVSLSGATATYRVSKNKSIAKIIEKTETSGITLSGSTATVTFNTEELGQSGDFIDQLRITKAGSPMVVSEGKLKVKPLIE